MNSQSSNRDPVCGMSVNPDATIYRYDYQGKSWYFCAENCLKQFKDHPEQYAPKAQPLVQRAKNISLTRELLVGVGIFLAVVALIIMARGIAQKSNGQTTQATVTGSSAGQHQAVDDGSGGVIATATHESAGQFLVALNTHTTDLTGFDPAKQVRLHAGSEEFSPQTAVVDGDESTHHQNYRLTFADSPAGNVWIGIHNVGGVEVRQLPFNL